MQIPINVSPPPASSPDQGGEPISGVLISRDLIFTTKITGTARALGYRVAVTGNAALAVKTIEESRPKVVIVDLAAGEPGEGTSIRAYQSAAGPETPIVAFGSHVDTKSLDEARTAGCREVMPRSRFTLELPDLIRKYCGSST